MENEYEKFLEKRQKREYYLYLFNPVKRIKNLIRLLKIYMKKSTKLEYKYVKRFIWFVVSINCYPLRIKIESTKKHISKFIKKMPDRN